MLKMGILFITVVAVIMAVSGVAAEIGEWTFVHFI